MIGDKTKDAIRAEQQRLGLTVNGRGGQKILLALRAATPALPPVSQATPHAVVQPTANVPASAPQLSTPAWNTAP
jgi:peptidoglycan hydrolase-like protein with peptidoglycan-binding domain